jgi:hypothetical protein
MQNIAEGRFFPPSVLNLSVPPGLEREILRAMSTEPSERFASVYAFGQALLPFASPRERVRWGEYFGRAVTESAPAPARSLPTGTALLPELPPELMAAPAPSPRGPAPRPVARDPVTRSSHPHAPARVPAGAREPITPPPRRKHRGLIALAALTLAAAWAAPRVLRRFAPAGSNAVIAVGPAVERGAPAAERPGEPAPMAAAPAPAAPVASASAAPPPPAAPLAPTAEVIAPPPAAAEITVDVATEPPGASVWVAAEPKPRGQTPLVLTLPVSPEPLRMSLRLTGHRPRTIAFVPERPGNITLTLVPLRAVHPPRKLRGRHRSVPNDAQTGQQPAVAPAEQHPPPDPSLPSPEDRYEKILD